MEQPGSVEQGAIAAAAPPTAVLPSFGDEPCPTCSAAGQDEPVKASFVYVFGQFDPRIPRLDVEKELAQATGRADTAGFTDRQALHKVLSQRENRYLARQMCWVLTIQGLETYLVLPRDPADLDALIAAIKPQDEPLLNTLVGVLGPLAPPAYCNGLVVPMLLFDQIYTFSRKDLLDAIPRPHGAASESFDLAAGELFDRLIQITDNAGATDTDRALNYLCVRYPAIYAKAAEQFARDFSLTAVDAQPSPLSSVRKIVVVIFVYKNRNSDFTEKFFVRVDVTEEFPFLVSKLAPYYDR